MEIRLANKNDIDKIAELWEKIDYFNKDVLEQKKVFRDGRVGGKERYTVLLNKYFGDPAALVVVAEADNEPVGFVICFIDNQFGNGIQDAIIDVAFVNESARGQGVGTKMYAFLESLLQEKGIVGITTEVFDNNQMSINFHEKMGFHAIAKSIEMYKKL